MKSNIRYHYKWYVFNKRLKKKIYKKKFWKPVWDMDIYISPREKIIRWNIKTAVTWYEYNYE
jgi:hypothetical protein